MEGTGLVVLNQLRDAFGQVVDVYRTSVSAGVPFKCFAVFQSVDNDRRYISATCYRPAKYNASSDDTPIAGFFSNGHFGLTLSPAVLSIGAGLFILFIVTEVTFEYILARQENKPRIVFRA